MDEKEIDYKNRERNGLIYLLFQIARKNLGVRKTKRSDGLCFYGTYLNKNLFKAFRTQNCKEFSAIKGYVITPEDKRSSEL